MFKYEEYIRSYKDISVSGSWCWESNCNLLTNTDEIPCRHSVIDSEEHKALDIDKASENKRPKGCKIADAVVINKEYKAIIEFKHLSYKMLENMSNKSEDGGKYYKEYGEEEKNCDCMAETLRQKMMGTREYLREIKCSEINFEYFFVCKLRDAPYIKISTIRRFGMRMRKKFKKEIEIKVQLNDEFDEKLDSYTFDIEFVNKNNVFIG
jgi:hypothetical protein